MLSNFYNLVLGNPNTARSLDISDGDITHNFPGNITHGAAPVD